MDARQAGGNPLHGALDVAAAHQSNRPDAGAQPGGRKDAPCDPARLAKRGPHSLRRDHALRIRRVRRDGESHSQREARFYPDQLLAFGAGSCGAGSATCTRSGDRRPGKPALGAGDLFDKVRSKPVPDWASEFEARSWAQFFLKWVVANPAVTCAIPATSKPAHLQDNMRGGVGRLPDASMRRRMLEFLASL